MMLEVTWTTTLNRRTNDIDLESLLEVLKDDLLEKYENERMTQTIGQDPIVKIQSKIEVN